jgi:CheY-like chemotaxis protein
VTLSRNELRHRARFAADFRPVPLVEADEGRLTQVFLNLLANAAHAIPLGQADRHRICARTYTDEDGHAVMEIEDSGAGIPEAIKSRVFDPFFTTKPVGQGSGLGLSICHGIIQSMGGEIGFESEPGRGTTFRVRLPPAQQQTPERRSSGSMKIAASVARARVLVVDDEAAIGRAVARALSPHAVDVVSSAHHALRKIETTDYDVVLTDVMMPQTSGIELFERLRERGDDLSHRVVFMTGGTFDQRMQDALESLPNRKLEKPIAIEKLRNVVADLRARRSTRG